MHTFAKETRYAHYTPSRERVFQSSHYGSVVTNLTSIHEDVGLIPGLTQWVKDPVLP